MSIISYLFMIKLARKPSSDPVQEKLRQAKAVWNKEVSTFVNDLIHYKKLMNGWSNKFHMEKSMIKDPIPADPATIIASLVSDFNDIAQKGNALVKEQLDYSKARKKKQPKSPSGSSPADLSQQLSLPLTASFNKDDGLFAEASNPISRFFSKLLMPSFGVGEAARIGKYRKTLLDSCVLTYKDLEKLQVEIVKSSDDSIANANKILNKTWTNWMIVYRGYTTYKNNMPRKVEDTGGEIESTDKRDKSKNVTTNAPAITIPDVTPEGAPKQEVAKSSDLELLATVKSIIQDYKKVISSNRFPDDMASFKEFNNFYTQFVMAQPDKKISYANDIVNSYNYIINELNIKYNTNGTTLIQIANFINKSPMETAASFEKESQDSIKKWIGKTRHQFSIFNKTSVFRLDVYKMAGDIRVLINDIMNSLEKSMKIEELDPLIMDVNRNIIALRGLMRALNNVEPDMSKSPKTSEQNNMLDRIF